MDLQLLATLVASALSALIAVRWVYFKVLKLAKEKNLVDNPDARKLQKKPVPVVGGIAVFFGFVMGVLVGYTMLSVFGFNDVPFISLRILVVILSMSVMLYSGALDDIVGLSPCSRFVIEIFTILAIVYTTGISINSLHGLWGIEQFSSWVSVPLTVFAGVGIINAINMIDGVNGLSSGLCISCCLLFGCLFVELGDVFNAILAFTMTASLLLFFVFNVFGDNSRMFIGDAGTMVMGMLMTWFVICVMSEESLATAYNDNICVVAMVVAFLSVPIADTLRVMTVRMLKGKSPFSPDKTHLHHSFIAMGVSHSITSLSIILINITVVGFWRLSVFLGAPLHCQLYLVIIVAAILVWGTYVFLKHEQYSTSRKAQWLRHLSIKTHFGKTEWWQRLAFFLDAPEFNVSQRRDLKEKLERKFMNR
ncbi:MAG: undecaprenyl/decaprenyl-phosphate alpha-N-acetylglucosaminyl 1-phosphate transferase [Bacteroidaceae bacterium]|nr:undecaprenyl/decaprenyl-phosphate alpha-N-acetylglucosaminyl 1-phosphate transferase [Bacteroidaceae bacterium]